MTWDELPLWLIFTVSAALIGLAQEFGRRVRRRLLVRRDDSVFTLEAAVLGLLALMISFTFSMALSHFDARRAALVDEANAIGTAALRARLLPAPHGGEVIALLRRYVALRVEAVGSGAEALAALAERAGALQESLWRDARAQAARDSGMVPTGLYIQALNEMFDVQQRRLIAAQIRIPALALIALYGVALVAVFIAGYATGLQPRRTGLPTVLVGILIAAVILLVLDLDRPQSGFIRVDQQPMTDLAASLAAMRE
jgi:hypothetical protein